MRKVFWIFTLVWTVLAAAYLVRVVADSTNPTELTAAASLSMATALIPYVMTRCLEGLRHADVVRVRVVGQERGPVIERRPDPVEHADLDHLVGHRQS
ncbi:MAG TPA: hypothetical protein VFA50_12335 [Stellaceae bacterium]|nr:hypothetical protein [Stellaceae bacterium]